MSAENFFDILPENFFNIFIGNTKRSAAECLTLLYKKTSHGLSFSIGKEDAIILIEDYFLSTHQDLHDDQNKILDAHESALYLIKRLKECGWCEEERGEDYQTFIHLEDYAVEIIKTLSSLNQDSTMEYSGFVSQIYDGLKALENNIDAIRVERIYATCQELFRKLASLNTNIKKYIQLLMKDKNKDDLEVLMNMLLEEYQSKIVDRAYYNLTTKDHPEKYRQEIIDRTYDLLNNDEIMESLTRQLMDRKDIEYKEAYLILIEQLNYIIECFDNINEILEEINYKNNKYVSSALSRITFLLDVQQDIEGKLNHLIKAVNEDKITSDDLVKMYEIQNINKDSLYVTRKKNNKIKSNLVLESELDEKVIEAYKEKMLHEQRFSKKGVWEYLEPYFKDKTVIQARDLRCNTTDEFTYLILIYMYGYSTNMKYEIEDLETRIEVNQFKFKNFMIRRNYE